MDKMSSETRARVDKEYTDLLHKVCSLELFLSDKDPETDADVERLTSQLAVMNAYADILKARLEEDDRKGGGDGKPKSDSEKLVNMKADAMTLYKEVEEMWWRVSMHKDPPDEKEMVARLDGWKNRLYEMATAN